MANVLVVAGWSIVLIDCGLNGGWSVRVLTDVRTVCRVTHIIATEVVGILVGTERASR